VDGAVRATVIWRVSRPARTLARRLRSSRRTATVSGPSTVFEEVKSFLKGSEVIGPAIAVVRKW
jgi:hypothetical protein